MLAELCVMMSSLKLCAWLSRVKAEVKEIMKAWEKESRILEFMVPVP